MEKRSEPKKTRKKVTSPAEHSTKKRKKRKGNIFAKILLYFFMSFCFIFVACAGLIMGFFAGYVEDTELVDVESMRLNLTSFIYVKDAETGEYVEYEQLYDTENRVWISGSDMPDHLKDAFVAIEDERFYSHSGVDLKRFIGAAYQYISNDGNSSYGGSTITQQLIKNITQDDDYSVRRKVQEIYRAYNLEKELSKDEILEYYLNTIYLSQKCNGVGSAAMTYFGKDVSDLTLAESAVLAGITKYPTKYDPIANPENNRERQLVILDKMLQLGFITKDEYNEAKNEDVKIMPSKSQQEESYQSYFTDAAIDQVVEDMMTEYNYTKEFAMKILYNGGLKIYLSMDPTIQSHMDAVYNDPDSFQKTSAAVQPQSSMVIMDPYTGLVKGLVGGRGEKEGNRTLNRATQTLRQPGSTIKPLTVYSPAIEYGLVEPSTIVNDAPITFDGNYTPRNDDHSFSGRITVSSALRGSRNVPATKICNYLTPEASFNFMRNNYHVNTLVKSRTTNGRTVTDMGLGSIALGGLTDGVSVIDMCAAYCVFPNGGKYIKPSLYTKVLDSEGNLLLEHKAEEVPAISEDTAKDMIGMMEGVVTGGTGTSARLPNMRAAGKTGTTNNKHDRWFVGCTPYYVGAVWFGYDIPAPLNGFSSNPAAVAWRKVMTPIHENLPNKNFLEDDDGKYDIMVCAESGMRVTPACTEITYKTYKKGDVPSKRCTDHPYEYGKNELNSGKIEKEEDVEGIIENPEGGLPEGENPEGTSPPEENSGEGTSPENNTPSGSEPEGL